MTCTTTKSEIFAKRETTTTVSEPIALKETRSSDTLDTIESACISNLQAIEAKCVKLRGKIEDKWKRVEEIRNQFQMELTRISEVETIVEQQLMAIAGGKHNPNAVIPAAIESNIKALHIKRKRALHSVDVLSKILDDGADPVSLPMVATGTDDRMGIEADTLLAEIEMLQQELDRTEASCAL
jgi:hypothetical protein